MASISSENAKEIRDNIGVQISIVGEMAIPVICTWDAETKRLSWTEPSGVPFEFISLRVNDKTTFVTTAGKRWYPNPSGMIFITEHSSQIAFRGDGAEPYDVTVPTLTYGLECELDSRSLTECSLALRGNLDLVNPSFETSEINLSFMLPDVRADVCQFIATHIEGAGIWYRADYGDIDGDDTLRAFNCTSKGLTVSNKVVTLTGVDQSEKLSKSQMPRYFAFTYGAGFERMYALFRSFITNAGITLTDYEEPPSIITDGDADLGSAVYMDERPYSDYIMYFMRHMVLTESHQSGTSISWQFYPRYVDAGRPKVTWRIPEAKWVIDKAECGNIQYGYEPAIKSLTIDNDTAETGADREAIETKTVKNGHRYAFDMQTPHRSFTVTGNATIIKQNCMRVVVRATADGDITLRGIPIEFYDDTTIPDTFTFDSYGQDIDIDGEWHFEGAAGLLPGGLQVDFGMYEDWYAIDGITQTVTFTWKGDPRMQPLDVFIWDEYIDGTPHSSVWTIASITLDHTGGGLSAEITARRGIL